MGMAFLKEHLLQDSIERKHPAHPSMPASTHHMPNPIPSHPVPPPISPGGADGPLSTYTIMTVDSSPRLTWLHDRMPVLLTDEAAVQAWLGGGGDGSKGNKQQVIRPGVDCAVIV